MRLLFITIVFILGLFIRLFFVPNPGFEADIAFWKGWGLAAADNGGLWAILNTNNNYPTLFVYTLGAMVHLYRLLGGDPHNVHSYWMNTNLRFLFVSKLPSILADVGIAGIILYVGKRFNHLFSYTFVNQKQRQKQKNPITALLESQWLFPFLAALYLLNPVSIMDGSWWGQVDSLGVAYFLLVVIAILHKRMMLTGALFIFAMMTKLQNMIYGPLLFVFIWHTFGVRAMTKTIVGAIIAFFGLNIEFFLSKNMHLVIGSLINNYDYFPYMSLHAYNPWWIISEGNGMGVSDKFLVIGILNAKTVGTIIFASCYLVAVLAIILPTLLRMKQRTPKNQTDADERQSFFCFILGLCLVNLAFFLFLTQSHERYAFPFFGFSLLLAPFLSHQRKIVFLVLYCVFSFVYFLNLHTAFAHNYPENVFQWLRFLASSSYTNLLSFINIAIFAIFILLFANDFTKHTLGIGVIVCIGLLLFGNHSYLLRQPIHLSSITPYQSWQAYGARQTNMPVSSSGSNPKSWTFLSTQYAFFRKGIGTHANSAISYDIGKKFSIFRTDYGIDTNAGTQASAIFEIWGDDKLLFQSDVMRRFDMPKHVVITVKGIKTLTLITREAKDGNTDDHTNWLNPKLYR